MSRLLTNNTSSSVSPPFYHGSCQLLCLSTSKARPILSCVPFLPSRGSCVLATAAFCISCGLPLLSLSVVLQSDSTELEGVGFRVRVCLCLGPEQPIASRELATRSFMHIDGLSLLHTIPVTRRFLTSIIIFIKKSKMRWLIYESR